MFMERKVGVAECRKMFVCWHASAVVPPLPTFLNLPTLTGSLSLICGSVHLTLRSEEGY